MARKFCLVAAGMFMLALSYHFGASTATAQAGGAIDGANIVSLYGPIGSAWFTGVVGRVFYSNGAAVPVPVPGTARVIATTGTGSSQWPYAVLLDNGDYYFGTGSQWTYYGNLLGSTPTPVRNESWSQLKSRYR